jgi:tetratricopeptide (TPR) repeat protein
MKGQQTLLIQYLILFVLSFGLYANTLNHQWASDDTMLILDNDYTKEGWEGIKKIWSSDSFEGFLGKGKNLLPGGRFRPVAQTVFNVQYTINGNENKPAIGHWTNVLLFSFAMVFLYQMLRRLFHSYNAEKGFFNLAFLSTILIAAHPLNTEVVANIKSLDVILSLLFTIGIFNFTLKYLENKKIIHLAGFFTFYLLGILSKESTATLFLLIPVSVLFFRRDKLKNLWPIMLSLTLSFISYAIIRHQALGHLDNDFIVKELLNDPFLHADKGERIPTVLYTWFVYLKLLIFPHPLTHDYYPYHIELTQWTNLKTITALVIYSGALVLSGLHIIKLFKNKDQKPNIYLYGFLFFFITFSVSSNLVFNIGAFMNERFIFVASIGFAIVLAKLIQDISIKVSKPIIIPILAFVFIVTYSLKTIDRNKTWKDDFTLFTTDVKTSSNSAKCNVSAGGSLYEYAITLKGEQRKKLLSQARNYVFKGIEIHPKNSQAWLLIGNIAFEQNDLEYTKFAYDNCLKLAPQYQLAINNYNQLAIKLWQQKKFAQCIEIMKQLPASSQAKTENRYYVADSYLQQQKLDTAITLLTEITKSDSTYAGAYLKLGEAFGKFLNQLEISERYLLKAYELEPKNSSVLENLGIVYGMKKEYEKSIEFLKKALEKGENKAQILNNIALTYHHMGNDKLAQDYLTKSQSMVNK